METETETGTLGRDRKGDGGENINVIYFALEEKCESSKLGRSKPRATASRALVQLS